MTSTLASYLNRLSQSQLDTITYESGFNADLTVASSSFNTYLGTTESTFQTGLQRGATVTFSFDPGAGFTAIQQDYAVQALALWSGMCGINFTYVANAASAQVVFAKAGTTYNGTTLAAGTYYDPQSAIPTRTSGLNRTTSALIVLDTSGSYGDFGSYTTAAGYGIDSLVHEVGHLVGLGHTGPYNGSVTSSTDQNNSTDVRTWSIMSYIQPKDSSAKYYGSYDPAGVNFGSGAGVQRAPYTPMGLDIFAAQRLEGNPTSTMFSGGQVFGFNSNIHYTTLAGTQAILSMYDFTVDTSPVVTLYDYGTGNTFDISGFSADATVNLNDGTFSSVDGLTDNIFIEYGTAIDTLVGGSGNDTITVNANGDTIDGGGGSDIVVFSGLSTSFTIAKHLGVVSVAAAGKTNSLSHVETLQFTDTSISTSSIACFMRGTRIATPSGTVAVEHLAIGDRVLTPQGAALPVRWIGRRRYRLAGHAVVPEITPVLIRAGALGEDARGQNVPRRDLRLSPQHALLLDGVLVPAIGLANGMSITQDAYAGMVAYFHIELDRHEIILAEGAAAESFADHDSRMMFENAASYTRLYPESPAAIADYPASRVSSGPILQAIWEQLAARAGMAAEPDDGMPGPLLGNLEAVKAGRVEGWAFDPLRPGSPVALEIVSGQRVVATALANGWRGDLVRAKLGQGRCAFRAELPPGTQIGPISVRRTNDQVLLPSSLLN